jgi:hypothetical protein
MFKLSPGKRETNAEENGFIKTALLILKPSKAILLRKATLIKHYLTGRVMIWILVSTHDVELGAMLADEYDL